MVLSWKLYVPLATQTLADRGPAAFYSYRATPDSRIPLKLSTFY